MLATYRRKFLGILAPALAVLVPATVTFAPALASAEPYEWSNVAMGGGGFVSGIISCPTQKNLFYARTDVGGAYRWDEAGQGWVAITDWASDQQTGFLGTEALAIDPNAPNKVYILMGISYFNGGKTAVARSNDYGATFAYTDVTAKFMANGNGMGRQSGERLAVDPNKGSILFCGSRANGLFKSIDGGVTWNAVVSLNVAGTQNKNGINIVLFDKNSGTLGNPTPTIYVGVSRKDTANFYVSKDGGVTWNPLTGAPTNYMPQRLAVASDGKIFITYGDGAGPSPYSGIPQPMAAGAIYKFDPKAGTWTDITPANTGYAFGGISVDASNSQRILASDINKYNANQTWIVPGGKTTTNGDNIFLSNDAGKSWTNLFGANRIKMTENGFPWMRGGSIHWAGSIVIDPFNPDRAFVTSGNGIFSTTNLSADTSTWKFTAKGLEETVPRDFVCLPNGPLVSVIYDYDGFVSTDVSKPTATGRHSPHMGSTTGLAFAYGKPNILARSASSIYITDNTGATWTQINKPSAGTNGRLAYSTDGSVLLWAEGSTLHRTADKGATWTTISGITFGSFPAGDTRDSSKFYAYNTGSGTFYVSKDRGLTFNAAGNPGAGGSAQIRATPGVRGDVWVALRGGGLAHSADTCATFTKIAKVSDASAVALGKAAVGKNYPSVYIWGTVAGVTGVFRSDDVGANWARVNDDMHQYGGPGNAGEVNADLVVYGRVFLSTAGRGIAYGEPASSTSAMQRIPISFGLERRGNSIVSTTSGRITLLDVRGRTVATSPSGSLDLANVPHGIYFAHSAEQNMSILK